MNILEEKKSQKLSCKNQLWHFWILFVSFFFSDEWYIHLFFSFFHDFKFKSVSLYKHVDLVKNVIIRKEFYHKILHFKISFKFQVLVNLCKKFVIIRNRIFHFMCMNIIKKLRIKSHILKIINLKFIIWWNSEFTLVFVWFNWTIIY